MQRRFLKPAKRTPHSWLPLLLAILVVGCAPRETAVDEPESPEVVDEVVVTVDQPDPETPIPDRLPEDELADGWIALFDGHTLFGWQGSGDANWRVEDGALVADQGTAGLLCTTIQPADYVLRLEYRAEPDTNSGVFLRTPLEVTADDVATKTYEVNIAGPDHDFPTGSLVGRERASDDVELTGEWQSMEITIDGDQIVVICDGNQVLEFHDPQPLDRGFIGLQFNEGPIAFRNIKLKPLGLESIFNGQDLSGWNTYPEMESEFSVTEEGYLHVKDGPGQLETEETYGNFILQHDCKTHAPNLNSGIFFRCIPGDQMNGYESQIHNGYEDGDRRKPVDCGTGGIFRRQDARFVMADDEEWFYKTIVVDGPHMAVWVNGIQVSDWTDTRDQDENPRRGLRLEPGTIIIQGHDPTTDISFRNFHITELP